MLDWLDSHGLTDNTLVLFVSDHGELAGEHGRRGKKTYYEASMHVPMIVRYPNRFQSGRLIEALVDPSLDSMATLLELCGIEVPSANQGVSYLPLLDGSATETRDVVFYEVTMEREGPERFPIPERGVRTRDWVYARTKEKPIALFNLRTDSLEMSNLVDSPEHAAVRQQLEARLLAHMDETGDDWDLAANFPPPDFQTHQEGAIYAQELLKRAIVEP